MTSSRGGTASGGGVAGRGGDTLIVGLDEGRGVVWLTQRRRDGRDRTRDGLVVGLLNDQWVLVRNGRVGRGRAMGGAGITCRSRTNGSILRKINKWSRDHRSCYRFLYRGGCITEEGSTPQRVLLQYALT